MIHVHIHMVIFSAEIENCHNLRISVCVYMFDMNRICKVGKRRLTIQNDDAQILILMLTNLRNLVTFWNDSPSDILRVFFFPPC